MWQLNSDSFPPFNFEHILVGYHTQGPLQLQRAVGEHTRPAAPMLTSNTTTTTTTPQRPTPHQPARTTY